MQEKRNHQRLGVLAGQLRLVNEFERRYLLALGGVGSGKTTLGYTWHHTRCEINRQSEYSLIVAKDGKYLKLLFTGYLKFLESCGLQEKTHFGVSRSSPYQIIYPTGHRVLFWSSETKIVSINASHAWCDESALFDEETAREVSQRIRCPNARLLQSLDTTTPEGINYLHEQFACSDMEREGRFEYNRDKLVLHSSSYDNPFLPDSYFTTLEDRFGWDEKYFANYVLGEWVNLSRDAFYFKFSDDNIEEVPLDPNLGHFYITCDNNVGKMQWEAVQRRDGRYCVVHDNGGKARNLYEVADEIQKALPPEKWHRSEFYLAGDAVLNTHRSNQTYTTGFQLLESLLRPKYPRLKNIAPLGNPLISERSIITNKALAELRLVINPKCKRVLHSIRATQSDGKNGIVKPSNDQVTHAMESVDHLLAVLEPLRIRSGSHGVSW